ncbi:MAG: AsmA family protein [Alphaproteobacteria bacterium]
MKRRAIVVAAILSLLTAAALIGPKLVDWNRYREEIAARVQAVTGRDLAIDGDVGVVLLPRPRLRVDGLRLASIRGAAAADMVRIESLRVDLALLPLLEGRIEPWTIRLVRPEVSLQVLPDGRVNWRFDRRDAGGGGGGGSGSGSNGDVGFDDVIIEDGTVTYADAGGVRTLVHGLSATVAAESLKGPFHAKGALAVGAAEAPLGFEVKLGAVGEAKASTVTLDLSLPGARSTLRFGGLVSGLPDDPSLHGKLVGTGRSLAWAAGMLGSSLLSRADRPFGLTANVSATSRRLVVDEIVAKLGDTEATGRVTTTFGATPEVDITLGITALTLDPWLEAPSPPPVAKKSRRAARGQTSSAPPEPAPPESPPPSFPALSFDLPRDIGITVALSADAIGYRDGVARHARLNAALAGGELTVSQASALLPGGTEASLFGFIATENGQPQVDLTVESRSDDLRAVLDWIGADVGHIPGDRLHHFSLNGKVTGSPGDIHVDGLAAEVDTTRLTGAAVLRLTGRPAFGANLIVDNFTVDGYFPIREPAGGPSIDIAPLQALTAFDADVKVRFGTLAIRETLLRDVVVDGTLKEGVLTLRNAAIGDLAGATAGFKGEIAGFAGEPRVRDLAWSIRTRQAPRLAQFLGISLPVEPGRLGSVAMVGTLNGSLDRLSVTARNELGGTVVTVNGTVSTLLSGPSYDMAIEASHASLADFVNLFADDYRPATAGLGAFALHTRAVGATGDRIGLEDFRVRLGPVNVSGTAEVALTPERLKLTAQLTAGDIELQRFLPARRRAAMPSRSSAASASPSPPPRSRGGHRTAATSAQPDGGGEDHWTREPFNFAFLNTFDAVLTLTANSLVVEDYTITEPRLRGTLTRGVLAVEDAGGKLFGGTVAAQGEFNATTLPKFIGRLIVANANVRQALATSTDIRIADGWLDLDTTQTAAGRNPYEMIGNLTGNGTLAVRDGVVGGFDLDAVNRRLGDVRDAGGLIAALQTGLNGGSTRFKSVNGTFQVRRGVLRTEDLRLVAESGQAAAVGSIDLPAWTTDSRIEFRIAAHPEAPPFALRFSGSLDNPRRVFDLQGIQSHLLAKGLDRLAKRRGKSADILRDLLPGVVPEAPKDPETKEGGTKEGEKGDRGALPVDLGTLLKRLQK